MGDFKRTSSRFNRNGGSSNGSSGGSRAASGYNRRSGGSAEGSSERSSGGSNGYQRRSSSGQAAGGKDFPFTRIANITIPKSATDEMADFVENELRNSGLKLTAQIYLGKGDNELVLKNGDMLLIEFKTGEKDKDFVQGRISVKN